MDKLKEAHELFQLTSPIRELLNVRPRLSRTISLLRLAECRPPQKQVTVSPTSPPPVISVRFVSPGQSRVVGALRGQAPSLVWQPVHFRGGASLHCAQHHFSAYTTPVHGNGRHRASSASASAITTPTHRSHIHRMAVPPRVNPEKRTRQCCAGHYCAGPSKFARIFTLRGRRDGRLKFFCWFLFPWVQFSLPSA
jgi:hypothetical protein